MTTKPFEVPYNFDESLVTFYQKHLENIRFLFLPPYKDDSINTRTIIQTNEKGYCYMPSSRDEYEQHLMLLNKSNLPFVILWQDKNSILTTMTIDYYIKLGACGFIIANDINAKIIKNHNQDLLVISSIVQRLCKGISQMDFVYYDYIVMYYPFNRSLNAIKKLQNIKDKIIIMPNTVCHADCLAVHHWFPTKEHPFVQDRDCMALKNIEHCCYIYPEHLNCFDNYVGGYKLQGREYPTEIIKSVCTAFFTRKSPNDLLEEHINQMLQNYLTKMSIDEYYNVMTPNIIDVL